MDLGIEGKTALVGGASTGLGFAVAQRLAQEGARLVICSRDSARIQDAAHRLSGEVLPIVCDLSDPRSIASLVREIGDRSVDILVHNTGGPPAGSIFEFDDGEWERAHQLVLMSFVRLTRAFVPGMRRHKWGRVVTISSMSAREPADDLALSAVYRAGALAAVRSMARACAEDNVFVNAVLPGPFSTDRWTELVGERAVRAGIAPEEMAARTHSNLPTGRPGDPRSLAATIAFLASDLNQYLSGAAIPVDGAGFRGIW